MDARFFRTRPPCARALFLAFAALAFGARPLLAAAEPTSGATSTPYAGVPATLPGTLEAARFDAGGEGIAYHDGSAANEGGAFRPEGVDITTASEGGYLVGWTSAGEWLRYSVAIEAAGAYQVQLRVASAGPGGTLHLEQDGADVTGPLVVPDTGGWQRWRTIAAPIALTTGAHQLRLVFDANGPTHSVGNVSWMKVVGRRPYLGTAAAIPGTLLPERFDEGGEGLAYHDTTRGNSGGQLRATDVDIENSALGGHDVGWISDGEWLAYTVTVDAAAIYEVTASLAALGTGARLRIEAGGTTTVVAVPATGGWQRWATVTVPIALGAGPQSITLAAEVGGFNLGPLSWEPAPAPPVPPTPPPALLTVGPAGDLQSALDAAQPGDTILLTPGATYVGNFVLPHKDGQGWITIRSAAPDGQLPPDGVRLTPAHAPLLPIVRSPNSQPAIVTAAGAHHYRLAYLELRANVGGYSEIIRLGDGSAAQNTLARVPHDLRIDHCYIHGDPGYGQKRGLALNSAKTTVRDSHVADIKAVGADSQAIGGWNGPGPYTIVNNYLEAAGEVIMFGGADPSIPNLVPSDIDVRGNHLTRPLSWRGQSWTVKNLFELKNAQRVIVDGNVLENHWAQAQPGYAVLFTPRNQDGAAPWTVVRQVRFTNNVVRHVSAGVNVLGSDTLHPSQLTNDIVIANNLFEDVSGSRYGGPGRFLLIDGGAHITVDHNTVLQDGWSAVYATDHAVAGFTFTNNIVPDYSWAVMGGNTAPGNDTIRTYFPGSLFLGGIFAGANAGRYPVGNFYPSSLQGVGFVDLGGANYRLAGDSLFRAGGTDGTDVGCDIDRLNVAAGTAY